MATVYIRKMRAKNGVTPLLVTKSPAWGSLAAFELKKESDLSSARSYLTLWETRLLDYILEQVNEQNGRLERVVIPFQSFADRYMKTSQQDYEAVCAASLKLGRRMIQLTNNSGIEAGPLVLAVEVPGGEMFSIAASRQITFVLNQSFIPTLLQISRQGN